MDKKKKFKSMYNLGAKSALITAAIMGIAYFIILTMGLISASSNLSEGFTALRSGYLVVYEITALLQFFKSATLGFIYAGLFTGLYFKEISGKIQKKSMYLYGIFIYLLFMIVIILVFQIAAFLLIGQGLPVSLIASKYFERMIDLIIVPLTYSAVFVYFFKRQLNKIKDE